MDRRTDHCCSRVWPVRKCCPVSSAREVLSVPAYSLSVGKVLRKGRRCGWQNHSGAGTSGCIACPDTIVELKTYIVEDNATIRENLVATLQELACVQAVGWAETEQEATTWLSRSPAGGWDLAIVDLFLKQGGGLGVLEACRGRQPGQRVIVLSNYATADMRKRCIQLGADAVFDKSNEIDALVEYCIERAAAVRPGA
jgi:two-component system, OmpR family, response regulator